MSTEKITFTIFCAGTGCNRDTKGEINRELFQAHLAAGGEEYKTCLFLEGVGAGAGKANVFSKDRSPKQHTGSRFFPTRHEALMGNTRQGIKPADLALGASAMNDNVAHAVATLAEVIETRCEGDATKLQVNMSGWSRGSATAIAISNALQEMYPNQIEINLFAFDPVAGPVNKDDKYRMIPDVVRDTQIRFARNEKRAIMTPVDLIDSAGQKLATAPIPEGKTRNIDTHPGKHGTAVKHFRGDSFADNRAITDVMWNEAIAFFEKHGTPLREKHMSHGTSNKKLHSCYPLYKPFRKEETAFTLLEKYTQMQQTITDPKLKRGQETPHRPFFASSSHEAHFKGLFPHLYGAFTEEGVTPESDLFVKETKALVEKAPRTYFAFEQNNPLLKQALMAASGLDEVGFNAFRINHVREQIAEKFAMQLRRAHGFLDAEAKRLRSELSSAQNASEKPILNHRISAIRSSMETLQKQHEGTLEHIKEKTLDQWDLNSELRAFKTSMDEVSSHLGAHRNAITKLMNHFSNTLKTLAQQLDSSSIAAKGLGALADLLSIRTQSEQRVNALSSKTLADMREETSRPPSFKMR